MEKFDIDNLQSINYYQKRQTSGQGKHEGPRTSITSPSSSDTATSRSASSESYGTSSGTASNESTTQNEKVDSIKSCESILKIFSFESRGFTKWNVKCTDFWKVINKHPEIKPVNCVIMDALHNKRDAAVQTEQKESEESFWARALYEIQKRNLHQVALAGAPKECKFCKDIFGDYESDADEDVAKLNNWRACRKGFREPSASTTSSEPTKMESRAFKIDASDFDDTHQQQTSESIEISEEPTNEEFTDGYVESETEPTPEESVEQLETIDFEQSEQLLEHTETTSFEEGALNVTEISETYMEEELLEDLDLVTPESDLSLADELNRELLRRLSAAITSITEEGNYWSVVDPVASKSSKGKAKTSKGSLRSIEEKTGEEGGENKGEIIEERLKTPTVESPQEKKSPKKDPKPSLRDNYNYAQKVLSLLKIDFQEYKEANTERKTELLRGTLKESYSKFVLEEPQDPVHCPCTEQMQLLTQSKCTCEAGICKPPKLQPEEIEFIEKNLPYGPGVECFRIMIEGIQAMKDKDLTVQEQSEEIKNILIKIQNRETKHGPCECILHTIDLKKIEEDAKYIKNLIFTSLDDRLDEKFEAAMGIGSARTEDKEVQIEKCGKAESKEKVACADICDVCGALICKCGKKKRIRRRKTSRKHKRDAKGFCTADCGCHISITC